MDHERPSSAVTGQLGDVGPLRRCICGVYFCPKRWNQGSCSPKCSDRAYNASHPVARQARLDFTPASSELAHALRGRETRAQRILARLRQGPASSQELLRVGGLRYSARVFELRRAGHRISTVEHADHAVYSLEEP